MQVILSINSRRTRANSWVSASGDHAKVVKNLMRTARRDMSLNAAEDAEIEALVQRWVPSDSYPLPKDEDHIRSFICNGFVMTLTSRSDARVAMVSKEVDKLLSLED